jgi:hypothetical protein
MRVVRGARIIFVGRAGIVAVGLDDDYVVAGDEVGQTVAIVVAAAIVVLIGGGLVRALAVAVEPIDDGVAGGGGLVGRREEDAVVAGFVEAPEGRSGTCPTGDVFGMEGLGQVGDLSYFFSIAVMAVSVPSEELPTMTLMVCFFASSVAWTMPP